MIETDHGYIRSADLDDAAAFSEFSDPAEPRALIMDMRREVMTPTRMEVIEMLRSKEAKKGVFYAIEDKRGIVRGFGVLKPASLDTQTTEVMIGFLDREDYKGPLAAEALHFLAKLAFVDRHWRKMIAQIVDTEPEYEEFLRAQGCEFNGAQRNVVYTQGDYHDLLTFTLYADAWLARQKEPSPAAS